MRLKKVEKATVDKFESGFFKDGENKVPIIERLNLSQNHENWLSLKIGRYQVSGIRSNYFGEVDAHNRAYGRGIKIFDGKFIDIGYWDDGLPAPGNLIGIDSRYGALKVGQCYLKDGKRWKRGTYIRVDGTTEEFDYAF